MNTSLIERTPSAGRQPYFSAGIASARRHDLLLSVVEVREEVAWIPLPAWPKAQTEAHKEQRSTMETHELSLPGASKAEVHAGHDTALTGIALVQYGQSFVVTAAAGTEQVDLFHEKEDAECHDEKIQYIIRN